MQTQDLAVFSNAAWLAARNHPMDWPPMLPPSPRGPSPVPVHLTLEAMHEPCAEAAARLAGATSGPALPVVRARASALQARQAGDPAPDGPTTSLRKRKAESQDPEASLIGMPTADDPAPPESTTEPPAVSRRQTHRMFDQLFRALGPRHPSCAAQRLAPLLDRLGRLDQDNSQMMEALVLEVRGPRMSVSDLERLLTAILRLHGRDAKAVDRPPADAIGREQPLERPPSPGPILDLPLLELCYGLGKGLHEFRSVAGSPLVSVHLDERHAKTIEQVLAGSGLPVARQAMLRDVLYLRTRPCGIPLTLEPARGEPSRARKPSAEEPSATAAADGPSLANSLVEALADLDLRSHERLLEEAISDPAPQRESKGEPLFAGPLRMLMMRRPSQLLEDVIRRWLAPAHQAGPVALEEAMRRAIDDVSREGHRLGRHARHVMRLLVLRAGGPQMAAPAFSRILCGIIDAQATWKPDPHLPAPLHGSDLSPLERLACGLAQGTSLRQGPDDLPVLTTHKRQAALAVIQARTDLDARQQRRLLEQLGIKGAAG